MAHPVKPHPGVKPHSPEFLPLNWAYPGLKRVHEKPPIYAIESFLTDAECDDLIATAEPLLQRSKTHAVAGSEATKGRTSLTCHLAKTTDPCPRMMKKLHTLTNKPFGHMELPQVARYTDSQRYIEHYDGVDPHTEAGRVFCANGGQRVGTIIMYLNDVPGGGGTFFRRINFEVKPRKGLAVVFFPGFMNGELDADALHCGQPPVGVKYVSQVWIRKSFREDGQPSSPVPASERVMVGPLHEGCYAGHCLAGDDIHEAMMTYAQAKEWAARNPLCQGFTFQHSSRQPEEEVRVWFKSRLRVLHSDGWWSVALGRGI